uniref:Splicing factor, suppressor of white-apricot homolog n=1 Tax=Drosophila rhopaloa TaxID=1041015 RepID=A0A6P4FR52_DRORH
GQLKTKNGQKYVFNGHPSGVYVSKACLVVAAFITVLALLFTIAITYFVTRQGLSPKEVTPSITTDHSDVNATSIQTAGWVSMNSPPPLATPTPAPTPTPTTTSTSTTTSTTLATPTSTAPPPPEVKMVDPPVGDIPEVPVEVKDNNTKPTNRPLKVYEGWRPLHY